MNRIGFTARQKFGRRSNDHTEVVTMPNGEKRFQTWSSLSRMHEAWYEAECLVKAGIYQGVTLYDRDAKLVNHCIREE